MKNQNKILLGIAAIFLVVIAAAALDVHAQYNQPSLPDLQTIDVGYGSTDYPLSVGDSIKEARFPITNAGGTSASNINYEISVYDTATTDISLCTKTGTYSGTIDPGVTIPSDNNIISISCPAFSYGGTYALRVRLDSNSKIAELNEGNNIAIKDFNVAGGIAVDYGIGVTVNGPGSVISNDGRINCGPKDVACFAFYSLGSTVTLNALPSTKGANFDGWSGACSGTGACFVTVSQAGPNSVTASFSGGTIIIEPTQPFNLDISTDKYYYTAGEQVKVSGILTSNNNLGIGDLGNADVKAVISYTPSCPTGMGCAAMLARLAEIQLKFVGAVAPACKVQEGGVTTCPAYAQYYYVGYYTPTFAGGKFFVDGTAIANGISATDSAQFETIGKQSGEEYDAVDLSISPEEQRTVVGESVTYLLTITDKHKKGEVRPVLCKTLLGQICPPPEAAQYIYNLELFGLPYPSSFSQSSVTLSAGQSTDVRLIVYPSSTAIQQQVVTATAVPVEPQQTVTEPAA
ncbi:TPA: hypothetical protein H1012_01675, partial [archaeon]|nr:hypothetical protein [Candidatus Naiadarchaeales archaeon SRR2090159.bin1288]